MEEVENKGPVVYTTPGGILDYYQEELARNETGRAAERRQLQHQLRLAEYRGVLDQPCGGRIPRQIARAHGQGRSE